ncbi:amidohydrolase [Cytophaga aurantiaca]|uniref:amidohydrolase n=1 Tax=Cytophaga aurantiaca TaxID=29530 RepID=UPI000366A6AF|nr:amidohydrolase [Cytophaga aurantiaca]
MQDLTVSLIQTPLYYEDPVGNRAMLEEKIAGIGKTDVIVLPEMFTTSFTNDAAKFAEPANLHTFKWMKQLSAQTGACIVGSYAIKDGTNFYNRLLWMQPDGKFYTYDKRHAFRMSDEHKVYTSGNKQLVVEFKGWKIAPFICYDLRFPVWSRNTNNKYDLAIYVANWPAARAHAWKSLLPARAIENISYVIGLNRIGTDGLGLVYSGDSIVQDFKGMPLAELHSEEKIATVVLSKKDLNEFREIFPAYLDGDGFELKL